MSNPMMTLSAQELQARSKVPLTVLPDVQQTMEHCARSIAGRNLTGGTAPAQVATQIAFWKEQLAACE